MLLLASACALFMIVLGVGCCSRGAGAASDPLGSVLKANKFTPYTPPRSSDFPGTVFLLAKTTDGITQEALLIPYDELFDLDDIALADVFDPEGEEVVLFNEYEGDVNFGGGASLDLLNVLIKGELAAKYKKNLRLSLGTPQIIHRMPLSRPVVLDGDLSEIAEKTLRIIRERDQLRSVFVVFETLTVDSLKAVVTVEQGFSASVIADEIKEVVDVGVEVDVGAAGQVVIRRDQPVMIGYKAAFFPDTLLSRDVSSEAAELMPITTAKMSQIKSE